MSSAGTWTRIEGRAVFALAVDLSTRTRFFLGSDGDGIWKRVDRGKTWHYSGSGAGSDVSALAVDPRRPTNVYATATGPYPDCVFRSRDGGNTWRVVSSGLGQSYVGTLAVNPHSPATLYAGGLVGVFKSTNAGSSWRRAWPGSR